MNIAGTRKTINLIISSLDTTKTTASPIEFGEKKPYFERSENRFFERVAPESVGIESRWVNEFLRELRDNRTVKLHGIMLMRNGKVFFEGDTGARTALLPKATFSECKSIVAIAIGALVTQGRLKLNEKLVEIFADKTLPVSKIRLKNLTVKHLLTMRSAVTFAEGSAMVTSDWVRAFMNSDIDGEVGKSFKYNSLNTYMLSAIITERTGMSLSEYLDNTVFGALGITDYYWEKCPSGIEKGGWGLYIRREDLMKLGYLVMNNGFWQGKKLIASKYIADATKMQSEVPEEYGNYNYGFQIWCGRDKDSFLFNGMLGQNLLGYRNNGIIIAANCGNADMFQKCDFFEICDRYFSGEFPESIEENPKSKDILTEVKDYLINSKQIDSFLSINKSARRLEADLEALDGRHFEIRSQNRASVGFMPLLLQIIQGNYTQGLKSIWFRRSETGLFAEFIEEDEIHRIEIGFDFPLTSKICFHGEYYSVAAKGRFSENEDGVPVLIIECEFLETPYSRNYKFFFEKGNYFAVFKESPGIEFASDTANIISLLGANGQRLENIFAKIDGDYLGAKAEKAFLAKLLLKELI